MPSRALTWFQISTLRPDQLAVKDISALKFLNKLCWVILFRSIPLKMAKLRQVQLS